MMQKYGNAVFAISDESDVTVIVKRQCAFNYDSDVETVCVVIAELSCN